MLQQFAKLLEPQDVFSFLYVFDDHVCVLIVTLIDLTWDPFADISLYGVFLG